MIRAVILSVVAFFLLGSLVGAEAFTSQVNLTFNNGSVTVKTESGESSYSCASTNVSTSNVSVSQTIQRNCTASPALFNVSCSSDEINLKLKSIEEKTSSIPSLSQKVDDVSQKTSNFGSYFELYTLYYTNYTVCATARDNDKDAVQFKEEHSTCPGKLKTCGDEKKTLGEEKQNAESQLGAAQEKATNEGKNKMMYGAVGLALGALGAIQYQKRKKEGPKGPEDGDEDE